MHECQNHDFLFKLFWKLCVAIFTIVASDHIGSVYTTVYRSSVQLGLVVCGFAFRRRVSTTPKTLEYWIGTFTCMVCDSYPCEIRFRSYLFFYAFVEYKAILYVKRYVINSTYMKFTNYVLKKPIS